MRIGWWWARRQLIERPVAHVALVVLIAFAGGLSLLSVTGARRTQTSFARLEAISKVEDAGIAPAVDPAVIRRLPNVSDATIVSYVFLSFPSLGADAFKLIPFASADDHGYRTIDRGVVVAGRRPDPHRENEVSVSPAAAARLRLRPGTDIDGQLASASDIQQVMAGGELRTTGPRVHLRVVGIVRQTTDLAQAPEDQDVEYLGGSMSMYLTSAFFNEQLVPLLGPQFVRQGATMVRLRHGDADVSRLRTDVSARFPETADPGAPGVQPSAQERTSAHRAIRIETAATVAFAIVLGLASLVLVGQAVVRQQATDASAATTLRALGFTTRELFLASVAKTAMVAMVGALGAVGVAVGLSVLTPIGLARQAEPNPGVAANVAILAVGATLIVVLLVLWAVPAALQSAYAAKNAGGGAAPARLPRAVVRSAPALAGIRMALDRGRPSQQLPVRSAVVTVAAAVAMVTAATTVGASLVHLVRTPTDYSWNWDVAVGNPNNGPGGSADPDALASSLYDGVRGAGHISGFSGVVFVDAAVGGEHVRVMGADTSNGTVLPTLVAGRYPARSDEFVTTRGVQRSRNLRVGSPVVVRVGQSPLRGKVVGTIARPPDVLSQTQGEVVLTTLAALHTAAPDLRPNIVLVRYGNGASAAAQHRQLRSTLGPVVLDAIRSSDVENLARLSWLPNALAGLLGVMALATFAHTLLVSARRRRAEIAVLKTLGFGRREVAAALAWYASLLAIIALIIGLPLGIAAGRITWRIVAEAAEVVPSPRTPVLAAVTVAVTTLLAANLLAAGPGWAASRVRPTEILRAD